MYVAHTVLIYIYIYIYTSTCCMCVGVRARVCACVRVCMLLHGFVCINSYFLPEGCIISRVEPLCVCPMLTSLLSHIQYVKLYNLYYLEIFFSLSEKKYLEVLMSCECRIGKLCVKSATDCEPQGFFLTYML